MNLYNIYRKKDYFKKLDFPKIILIDGLTCSGKTKFADILAKILSKKSNKKVLLINKDNFLFDRKKRIHLNKKLQSKKNYSQNKMHYNLFKFKRLVKKIKKIINQKKHSETIKFKNLYNRSNGKNNLKKTYKIRRNTFIIIEGLYVFDDFNKIDATHKYWLTCSKKMCIKKKFARIRDNKINKEEVLKELELIHFPSLEKHKKKYVNEVDFSVKTIGRKFIIR